VSSMKAIGVIILLFSKVFIIDRVTSIYTIPNKDILITISESNIKVWDLEYDECIKNMNEHNSSIVYINQSP